MRHTIRRALAALATVATAAPAAGQFQFTDVADERGLGGYVMALGDGGGVAAADFDDDGDIDLFVPTAAGMGDRLYENLGDGHFTDIAEAAGLAFHGSSRVAVWLDYDGDHRLDLFVAGDCWQVDMACTTVSTLRLYRQGPDGVFEEVAAEAGLGEDLVVSPGPHRSGVAAGDLDNDGWIDLVFGLWQGEARVFLNNADPVAPGFTEISDTSGVGGQVAGHWQPVMHDFDGDGWLDVYQAVDFTRNYLWINDGDPRSTTFTDRAIAAGVNSSWNDMGQTLGDYDNDGDLDIYITNIFSESRHNVLYRNDSDANGLAFADVAPALGVDNGGWGWGCAFLDADNDGWLDLVATNGWFDGPATNDKSVCFRNNGTVPASFTDVSAAVGYDDTLWGSCVVPVDVDRDGDLDLVQTCNGSGPRPHALLLLRNDLDRAAAAHHTLVIKPRMEGPNHRAIGAVVRVTAGGLTMMRVITAGTSFLGQEPAEAFFGLGAATIADEVVIEWPGGGTPTVLTDVGVDDIRVVYPDGCGGPADVTCDGTIDEQDLFAIVDSWGACPGDCPPACAADLDDDCQVNVVDLLALLASWS